MLYYTLGSDRPDEIEISLPDFPEIELPERPTEIDEPAGAGWAALSGGVLGSIFGPWGAAAGAALAYSAAQESANKRKEKLETNYQSKLLIAYNNAVEQYLRNFSDAVFSRVLDYINRRKNVFTFILPEELTEISTKKKLKKIQYVLNNIDIDRY